MKSKVERVKGITLIELLVTITILAILGAIAIPAYSNYAQKSRRAEAKSALSNVLLAQERYFTVNGVYVLGTSVSEFDLLDLDSNLTAVSDCATGATTGDLTKILSEKDNYCIAPTAATTTSFTLRATAQNDQANDADCSWFDITHLGVKTAEDGGTPPTNCW
jgi:type IV pilus assembly protein PilE